MTTKLTQEKADRIIRDMEVWFRERGSAWFQGRDSAATAKERTDYQRGWDAGICAASEFVRRFMDYNEDLASQFFKLLTPTPPSARDVESA